MSTFSTIKVTKGAAMLAIKRAAETADAETLANILDILLRDRNMNAVIVDAGGDGDDHLLAATHGQSALEKQK